MRFPAAALGLVLVASPACVQGPPPEGGGAPAPAPGLKSAKSPPPPRWSLRLTFTSSSGPHPCGRTGERRLMNEVASYLGFAPFPSFAKPEPKPPSDGALPTPVGRIDVKIVQA